MEGNDNFGRDSQRSDPRGRAEARTTSTHWQLQRDIINGTDVECANNAQYEKYQELSQRAGVRLLGARLALSSASVRAFACQIQQQEAGGDQALLGRLEASVRLEMASVPL